MIEPCSILLLSVSSLLTATLMNNGMFFNSRYSPYLQGTFSWRVDNPRVVD